MRRHALPGLILAIALGLVPALAEAWPGAGPFSALPRAEAWPGASQHGGPFPGPPLGELQNEAWSRYMWHQYLRNNPLPPPSHPRSPGWAWVAPTWRWDGVRWVWMPGYWVPSR